MLLYPYFSSYNSISVFASYKTMFLAYMQSAAERHPRDRVGQTTAMSCRTLVADTSSVANSPRNAESPSGIKFFLLLMCTNVSQYQNPIRL